MNFYIGVVKNFAEKLYFLRTQHGYSQESLAEKLNVSRQSVSKWESNITLPNTDKLILLSDLFQVSVDFLIRDTVSEQHNGNLDRIIFRFLGSAQEMDDISRSLIDIMQDGIIDSAERVQMESILRSLDELSKIIDEIKLKIRF